MLCQKKIFSQNVFVKKIGQKTIGSKIILGKKEFGLKKIGSIKNLGPRNWLRGGGIRTLGYSSLTCVKPEY